MSVRISTSQFYNTNSANYQSNFAKAVKSQQEASDGIRVRSGKDDPVGAARLLQLEQQQNMLKQYSGNIVNVRNALGTAESTLNSIGTILQRVNELAVSSGNGTFTDADRKANADEQQGRERQVHLLWVQGRYPALRAQCRWYIELPRRPGQAQPAGR